MRVPIIGTRAVGDTGAAVDAGLFFDDELGPEAAASWMLDHVLPRRTAVAAEARRLAVEYFSLDRRVDQYLQALAYAETFLATRRPGRARTAGTITR